ncbi:substrate-binding domain-containing protein [Chlorogloeopsis sp. ULAP01]|uniref:substrate-binding domain-containing protein n=1 Tax=Chlorogloeopsis sp. ULAP01 TaxID=3056483 RepID=UPI0025AA71EE|nr:substrate-binding domain-containing protein [Chlorogloeopsis sp. ULAP01]MDM9384778.1 substrate-binding domain-containing protein [Chlorogloeopsis sp. ULAP01]
MKLNILFGGLAILAVELAGVTGCTSNTSTQLQANIQAQQKIQISGSSSTYPALKVLADAYSAQAQNTQVTFLPPNQSEATIAGVKEGILEIGSISKVLKPEENDGSIQYKEAAKDALLVATHPSVKGINNLTTEQLKAIYSGKIKNWKNLGGTDAKIVVLDRPEDESAKRLLRQYYLGKELKNTPDAIVLREEDDLIAAVRNTPYSIGAFSLAYAISHKLPVNRLSLNGVEPNSDNIRNGKYQMVRNIGIISKKTPKAPVQQFINFTLSEAGAEVLHKSGFVSSSQK